MIHGLLSDFAHIESVRENLIPKEECTHSKVLCTMDSVCDLKAKEHLYTCCVL
jgi:hypothetical protein